MVLLACSNEPTDTRVQVGVDEDDLPINSDSRRVMTQREAQEYFVEHSQIRKLSKED